VQPSSSQPTASRFRRAFRFIRDHPAWSAVGALAAVVAIVLTVAHDFFGITFSRDPSSPPSAAVVGADAGQSSRSPSTAASPVVPGPSLSGGGPVTDIGRATPPVGGGHATASPQPEGRPGPRPTPRPTCPQAITILAPSEGSPIAGEMGVRLSGTACGMRSGEYGWIFDYDPFDDFYYSADAPAVVKNGSWAYVNQPVGDPGDNNKYYQLQMVWAKAGCAEFLAAFEVNSEGDKRLRRSDFPSSCEFVGAVGVSVTWPS